MIVAILAALMALMPLGPMNWHDPKPLGLDVVTVAGETAEKVCAVGSYAHKFRVESNVFGIEAHEVEEIVTACGTRLVVLHGGVTAYDWKAFQSLWHSGGWGNLVNRHPEIEWWLEVGNEPEFAGMEDGAVARTATLRTYKTLALGIGSGEPAWREQFPNLRWLAALPLTMERIEAFMQWVPDNRAGWVNQGSIADWYDGIAPHVYGHYDVTDTHLWLVYNYAIRQHGVKQCIVTEAGINGLPPAEAMDKLAGFARWTPCRAVMAFAYFAPPCDWGGDAADSYHLCDFATFDRMSRYNRQVR